MALPVYLQQFKAAGVYRVVYDQSAIEGVDADKLRLVIGYSDKGPFNIPTYVKSVSEFRTLYGGVSKSLERRGVFFHRMAIQALAAGPILCLNLKPFTTETVGTYVLKSGESITNAPHKIPVTDIYDRSRFWELSEEKLAERMSAFDKNAYVSISATNSKETSISFIFRKAIREHTRAYDITVGDWYSDVDDVPEYLQNHLDDKMSDFMAEIYVFNTKFDATTINASSALSKFFNVTDNKTVTLKDKITNAWGTKVDALDELFNEPTSGAIGRYVGSLLPEFIDKQGNYMSLNVLFNRDIDAHNAMMAFNTDLLLVNDTKMAYECVHINEDDTTSTTGIDVTKSYLGSKVTGLYTYSSESTYSQITTKDTYATYGQSYFKAIETYNAIKYTTPVSVSPADEDWFELDEDTNTFKKTTDTEINRDKIYYEQDVDKGYDSVSIDDYVFDESNAYTRELVDGQYEYTKATEFKEGEIYYSKSISYQPVSVNYPISVKGLYTDEACTTEVENDTYPTSLTTSYYAKYNNGELFHLVGYDFLKRKPDGSTMNDKLKWHKDILGVLSENEGLRVGLLNKVNIDYRYIVDTFEAYPECHGSTTNANITSKEILSTLAKEKESAFAILNFPSVRSFIKYTDGGDSYIYKNANDVFKIDTVAGHTTDNSKAYGLPTELTGASFCAFYTPLKFSDGYIDTVVPSAALVSNLFIEKYNSRQPYYIVAGPNYGNIAAAGLIGPDYNYSKEELNIIEPFGVNCMVYRPGFGTFINANQTAKQTPKSALSSVNVRELVIYLQDEIEKVLQAYQWEFNNDITRNAILDKANQICARVAGNGGIQAYRNVMDTSNNTPEVIDNEMAILSTHIEPGRGCGKMIQELTIYRTGQMSANITEY